MIVMRFSRDFPRLLSHGFAAFLLPDMERIFSREIYLTVGTERCNFACCLVSELFAWNFAVVRVKPLSVFCRIRPEVRRVFAERCYLPTVRSVLSRISQRLCLERSHCEFALRTAATYCCTIRTIFNKSVSTLLRTDERPTVT